MMVEMKVFGLALDEDSQVPVLILKDMEEKKVLPIWIGAMEAMSISIALNGVELPRPMTHDLLLSAITHLEGRVRHVRVISLRDGTYYAEIEVEQGGARKRIDCRPSDGIALALRAQVPISVDADILDQAEASRKTEAATQGSTTGADKWDEILEKMTPDSKYKM